DEVDLKKALFQLNNAAKMLEEQGHHVERYVAITADLYGKLLGKGVWKSYEDTFAKNKIGILRVLWSKVELLRKP
ncbi:MAG: hypothetical protein QXP78_02815, partial [Candidatus Bathyarchaeia archaeon]